MSSGDQIEFTEEEYRDFFGPEREEPLPPKSRRLSFTVRLLGLFVAVAMASGGAFALFDGILEPATLRDVSEIEGAAWARVSESPYGFLVTDIRVIPIPEGNIAAFVTNNPPDGIISLDFRPFSEDRMRELMDHEIGHLVDFALWEPQDPERTAGLGTEAWAECAAVDAGTRRIDGFDPGGEYHCFADELETFEDTLANVTEICARWGARECRSAAELGLSNGSDDG